MASGFAYSSGYAGSQKRIFVLMYIIEFLRTEILSVGGHGIQGKITAKLAPHFIFRHIERLSADWSFPSKNFAMGSFPLF